jgi:hypothetical protein
MTSARRPFAAPGRRFRLAVVVTGLLGLVLSAVPIVACTDLGLGIVQIDLGLLIMAAGLRWLSTPSRHGRVRRLLALSEQISVILIGLLGVGLGLLSLVDAARAL